MAQSTKEIKRRIQGVGSIMQITNAMELVASAKLRKSREKLDIAKPYFETVYENINQILSFSNTKSKLMIKRPVKNRAIIIIASDKGLAGGYNINVVKKTIDEITRHSDVKNEIFTTGIKAIDLLKRKGFEVNKDFTYVDNEPTMDDAVAIGSYFSNKFLKEVYDEVLVVYTKFKSVISLEAEVLKLLPAIGFDENGGSKDKLEFDFEPSPNVVLTQMIKQYVNVTIYGCLLESSTSEQASRRTAMENASSNGHELLEDLKLEYNRARQASITQEISEIVGGAEALK